MKKYKKEEEYPLVDLYDKNGKRITDLKKYRNKEGEYDIELYDDDNRRVVDIIVSSIKKELHRFPRKKN